MLYDILVALANTIVNCFHRLASSSAHAAYGCPIQNLTSPPANAAWKSSEGCNINKTLVAVNQSCAAECLPGFEGTGAWQFSCRSPDPCAPYDPDCEDGGGFRRALGGGDERAVTAKSAVEPRQEGGGTPNEFWQDQASTLTCVPAVGEIAWGVSCYMLLLTVLLLARMHATYHDRSLMAHAWLDTAWLRQIKWTKALAASA
jgi:hypothetical protein